MAASSQARVGGGAQRRRLDAAVPGQPPDGELLGDTHVGGEQVHLGAVAGRKHDGFGHRVAVEQVAAQAHGFVAGQRRR